MSNPSDCHSRTARSFVLTTKLNCIGNHESAHIPTNVRTCGAQCPAPRPQHQSCNRSCRRVVRRRPDLAAYSRCREPRRPVRPRTFPCRAPSSRPRLGFAHRRIERVRDALANDRDDDRSDSPRITFCGLSDIHRPRCHKRTLRCVRPMSGKCQKRTSEYVHAMSALCQKQKLPAFRTRQGSGYRTSC